METLTVPIQTATPTKTKFKWSDLFRKADDAILWQMVGKGKIVFVGDDGGQEVVAEGIENFAVVLLGGQVLDGYAKFGLELPTIRPPMGGGQ